MASFSDIKSIFLSLLNRIKNAAESFFVNESPRDLKRKNDDLMKDVDSIYNEYEVLRRNVEKLVRSQNDLYSLVEQLKSENSVLRASLSLDKNGLAGGYKQ